MYGGFCRTPRLLWPVLIGSFKSLYENPLSRRTSCIFWAFSPFQLDSSSGFPSFLLSAGNLAHPRGWNRPPRQFCISYEPLYSATAQCAVTAEGLQHPAESLIYATEDPWSGKVRCIYFNLLLPVFCSLYNYFIWRHSYFRKKSIDRLPWEYSGMVIKFSQDYDSRIEFRAPLHFPRNSEQPRSCPTRYP